MRKLKVGMISFAHGHANKFLQCLSRIEEVEIVGIADQDWSRVESPVNDYRLRYYSDYRELLASDADAVVICSENTRHAQMTIDSARAGKHILCNKPLGTTREDMESMIGACRDNGVQLMTAFPCRYLPAVAKAKAALERGELGEIAIIKGSNKGTAPRSWYTDRSLSGGGAFMDHIVHVMDLILWFTGWRAEEVYAEAGTLFHDIEVEDAGIVHVKFDNGAFAVIDPSWSRPKSYPASSDLKLNLIGSKGMMSLDAFAQTNELYSDDLTKAQWNYWGDDMYVYMIEGFVHALLEGKQVPITGEDGMHSTMVALAASESARLGQPVKVLA
ncbi:Gfo/Idh/MocA family oxidoreductase [Paenibacillus filicis]|uniref:Gfo/Idh/MocA family oxidoreductase n=1 Tax=Paenibacillus gyeongsangnamensis TaxID=3388067 RepID=A0ABT4QGQ9_9BACL|nr:Gfo/Idh/MocA family oxidoreductase [Paenibacillus filicis]MCZ8516054.1 Gfo/Idh/MocA family oxidoreductase [Paenibacillus filicis]